MLTMKIKVFFCTTAIFFVSFVESFQKHWTKTNSWNDPANWDPPQVPCPNDNIVLRDAVIYIEQNVTITSGLNLLSDGEIVFGLDANLHFSERTGRKRRAFSECVGNSQQVSFVGQDEKQWLNPNNWDMYTNGMKNVYLSKAIPYLERVPCFHDQVSFPEGNAFEIDIADPITVKEVLINGELITMDRELQSYLSTKEGRSRFKFIPPYGSLNLNSTPCKNSVCKCENEILQQKICRTFTCPAVCQKRVRPNNDCCYHCGALVDFAYSFMFNQSECSSELRRHLSSKHEYAAVRLYMSAINHNIVQILLSEDGDGSSAESAADSIQSYINSNSPDMCVGGTMPEVMVQKAKVEKEEEETSSVSVALAVILPVLIVIVMLIFGVHCYRRRNQGISRRHRFSNFEDFCQYPGVNDVEMVTNFSNIQPSGLQFENPMFKNTELRQDHNPMKSLDAMSPEYVIPVNFVSARNMVSTLEPVEVSETPRYIDRVTLPDAVVGLSNPLFDDDNRETPPYPLRTGVTDVAEKLTPDPSEGDLECADRSMDSIKLKLELKLKDPSDTEDDVFDVGYEKQTLEPPVYESTTQDKLERKFEGVLDSSLSENVIVDAPCEVDDREPHDAYDVTKKEWVTDFDS